MNRRMLLKSCAAGLLLHRFGTVKAARSRRPNVVLILSDDQGFGDIGSHGNDKIDTPILDRFATHGARFDRFFVSPVCAPTRGHRCADCSLATDGVRQESPTVRHDSRSETETKRVATAPSSSCEAAGIYRAMVRRRDQERSAASANSGWLRSGACDQTRCPRSASPRDHLGQRQSTVGHQLDSYLDEHGRLCVVGPGRGAPGNAQGVRRLCQFSYGYSGQCAQ